MTLSRRWSALIAVFVTLVSCSAKLIAKLNSKTLWRMQIALIDSKTGERVESVSRIRFIEEAGFEPPSGKMYVESDSAALLRVNDNGFACNWSLGEDKNDKKDGLWIWGLFKEPKYPFLYFNVNIFDNIISLDEEERALPFEGPGSRLYCRLNHAFSSENGVQLDNAILTYKTNELAKADPLGWGGSINVGDELPAGTLVLTPVNEEVEKLNPL